MSLSKNDVERLQKIADEIRNRQVKFNQKESEQNERKVKLSDNSKNINSSKDTIFRGGRSVTGRISDIKQPRGGYVRLKQFEKIEYDDGFTLNEEENIHGSIIGMVVDYMFRYLQGDSKEEAFNISIKGAEKAENLTHKNQIDQAKGFLYGIQGVDDNSIISACKLVTFDCWYRSPLDAMYAKTADDTNPDSQTIENIRIMINRCITFIENYGPITKKGFTFEPENPSFDLYENMIKNHTGSFGGYTPMICSGDGDYLTKDTMWDLKVNRTKPTSKNTLQILIYWIMGHHSGQKIFKNIDKVGIFNARHNTAYLLDMKTIPIDVINQVEQEVIGY